MYVAFRLSLTGSPKETLKKLITNIKAHCHPSWNYEKTEDGCDIIYHSLYEYYLEKTVVFRVQLRKRVIIFEPIRYAGGYELFKEERSQHIIRLCAFLLKDYFDIGDSIHILDESNT